MFCFCFGGLDQALAAEPRQRAAPRQARWKLSWFGIMVLDTVASARAFCPCESEVALATRGAQPGALLKGGDGALAGEAAPRLGVFEMEDGADVGGDVVGFPAVRRGGVRWLRGAEGEGVAGREAHLPVLSGVRHEVFDLEGKVHGVCAGVLDAQLRSPAGREKRVDNDRDEDCDQSYDGDRLQEGFGGGHRGAFGIDRHHRRQMLS